MSLCFVDTNILIYARDPRSPERRATSQRLLGKLADEGRIVVSPQVLNEFAQNVIWKLPEISIDDVFEAVETLSAMCPVAMMTQTAISALALHRRYGYTVYDSANVVMALDAGCRFFISEDLQHRQTIAGMTIINPFEADLAELDAGA